ncbi:MAG TPA: YbhB/YbcL family Raf kinase inhibitor-like protein [Methanoregula sp.]|nr:YbhB/YbcL family Raf kinase inhibitor-like protein [Methanoregula sp.]
MKSIRVLCSITIVILVLTCGCTAPVSTSGDSPASPVTTTIPAQVTPATTNFTMTVESITPGSVLPKEFTCAGSYRTPGISWENVPAGTKSFALIFDDPDAPSGTFTHWIVYNIPADTRNIGPAQPDGKTLSDGSQVGLNSAGSRGYYPPCPPPGKAHRYIFRLYAVDMVITQPTADRASVDWALDGHTLGETQVVTTFKR